MPRRTAIALAVTLALSAAAAAQDAPGAADHPLVTRYPGTELAWQAVENFMPFRIPVGPVTGYRQIDDWIDAEGRVTRSFYSYRGTDRSFDEVYRNYLDAFTAEGFDIRAQGISDTRAGAEVGGRQWLDVYLRESPLPKAGPVGAIAAGTSSQGGQGGFVASKDRAAGMVHVAVVVEQHAEDQVAALIDIVEAKPAEMGLVAVDAEAIGRDLAEKGRVVLDGLYFAFDSAELEARSAPALEAVAAYLGAHPDRRFYVVGHTDAVGNFDYNRDLSAARAAAVVAALANDHGIAHERLQAHGVGPLVPVFTNADDAGRDRNRRVELVEWPG
ncbi:OmpA family protein [Rhodobacteraceae bacterium CCMM004]|nr:OmpA family protein [Rhodobacteraceae bacterium CCMM004]